MASGRDISVAAEAESGAKRLRTIASASGAWMKAPGWRGFSEVLSFFLAHPSVFFGGGGGCFVDVFFLGGGLPFGHLEIVVFLFEDIWTWVKIQIVPPVNIRCNPH